MDLVKLSEQISDFFFQSITPGILFGVVGTLIYCFIVAAFVRPYRQLKAFSTVNLKGEKIQSSPPKSVVAKNVDFIYRNSRDDLFDVTFGIYEYTVDGRKYRYKEQFRTPNVPDTITLYYRKDPSKAQNKNDFGGVENDWLPMFGILSLIGFLLTFVFLIVHYVTSLF